MTLDEERANRICAWLATLFGHSFEVLPFAIPSWAKYLEVDPWGDVSAHEEMPCPHKWHHDTADRLPKWTSDEWWGAQGRKESLFKSPEKPKCDYVWDALFDLFDANYRGPFAANQPN